MPIEKLLPLAPPPGVYHNGTKYQSKNRWFDVDKVRWLEGILRPIGGWLPVQWSASGVELTDSAHDRPPLEAQVSDTFFETTAGVLLQDHTPVGSPNPFVWETFLDSTSASLVIDTSPSIFLPRTLDTSSSDWPNYTESFVLPSDDYEVRVSALVQLSTFSTDFGGVGARLTGGTQQGGYAFGVIEDPGQPQYSLRVLALDGSILQEINTAVPADNLGTVVEFKLRVQGTTITAFVNGVQYFQITDTTYLTGQPGIVDGWAPHTITVQNSSGTGAPFIWFKQAGYSSAYFMHDGTALGSIFGSFPANNNMNSHYTVGTPTGRVGDGIAILPTANYEVSAKVHTINGAGGGHGGGFGGDPSYAGVTARTPKSAGFFDWAGYYFLYEAFNQSWTLFCMPSASPNGAPWTPHVFKMDTSVDSLLQGIDLTMKLKVNGSTITATVNDGSGDTVIFTTTDTTFADAGRAGVVAGYDYSHGAWMAGPFTVFDLSMTPQLLLSDTLVDVPPYQTVNGELVGKSLEAHVPVSIDAITSTTEFVQDTDLGFRQPFEADAIVPGVTGPFTSTIFEDICLAGFPRGSTAWRTNDGEQWFAVGTTSDAYKYSGGILFSLDPWKASTPSALSWADTPFGDPAVDGSFSTGNYGEGPYGLGLYGVGTGALTLHEADTWTLDNFGEQLVGCYTLSEEVYYDIADKFQLIPNAPSGRAIVVTPERFLFVLGADGDGRKVAWCDQGNITIWDPSAINPAGGVSQAGGYFLTTKGRLMGGMRTRRQTLLWTSSDLHAATFIAGNFVYSFEQLGDNCGAISPHSMAVVGDTAYWMSYGRFFVYDGVVRPLSCDVHDFIFNNLSQQQRAKIWAQSMTQFDEIWWFYPTEDGNQSETGTECDRYVIYNYRTESWYYGTLQRGTGVDRGVFEHPLMVGNGNTGPCIRIYQHEFGEVREGPVFAESGPLEFGGSAKQGPMAEAYYGDVGGDLQRIQYIVPDEKTVGDVIMFMYKTNYPNVPETEHGPFKASQPTPVRFTARQIRWRFEEDKSKPPESWRVGVPRLAVLPAGRR